MMLREREIQSGRGSPPRLLREREIRSDCRSPPMLLRELETLLLLLLLMLHEAARLLHLLSS